MYLIIRSNASHEKQTAFQILLQVDYTWIYEYKDAVHTLYYTYIYNINK
jgi:hypothetical protein